MTFFVELLGWIGSSLILLAYAFNLRGRWGTSTPAYLRCNVLGALFLAINTYVHRAYSAALLELVWMVVALPALWKAWKIR